MTGAVIMVISPVLEGNQVDLPEANTAFGDGLISHVPDHLALALHDDEFQTVIVIEMCVHRGHHEIVVTMMTFSQSFGETALVMVVDVGHGRDTGPIRPIIARRKRVANEVSHCF